MGKSNEKKRDFFWLSYSDLMTSLFFVMLVLFVLVYSMQNKLISDLEGEKRLRKEVADAIENIDTDYFKYDNIYQKHILNIAFKFPNGESDIYKIIPDDNSKKTDTILKELEESGQIIKKLILKFPKERNIKYFVVVEGQASKDGWSRNNVLSYHRAQSLVSFWESKNIGLDKIENCEIVIAGSGEKGVPRDMPDIPPANQKFLITIVPKIGELKK
jgi:hypothetical protein